jgi:hypothetical protein
MLISRSKEIQCTREIPHAYTEVLKSQLGTNSTFLPLNNFNFNSYYTVFSSQMNTLKHCKI